MSVVIRPSASLKDWLVETFASDEDKAVYKTVKKMASEAAKKEAAKNE
jgi:hypothetical protein